jgi:helix-turn-helix protein
MGFALDRLFPKRGCAPYSTAERLVVLVIIRAMSLDARVGAFNCFLSYSTIAKRSGVSIASVKRGLHKHCEGPAPLIYRSKPGHTRGYHHACYRFTLVRHPERFASARDAARAAHREEVDRGLRDLQADRIALQRQRQDFGGTLTDAEYQRRLVVLERTTRRMIPARAALKQPPRS